MTACAGRLGDQDGLACTNEAEHEPGHGCTYEGSWAPDAVKDEEVTR